MADVLARFQRWRTINAQLQRLWNRAVGQVGYVRREWEELETALKVLAVDGIGTPDDSGNGSQGGHYGGPEEPTAPDLKH